MSFIGEYESKIAEFNHLHPYSKEVREIIDSLNANHQKIAYYLENIKLIQYLSRCGIIQGFFFELFDIYDSHILKIKEIHKDKSIHPTIIKTNIVYPNRHIFLFRYYHNGKVSYLLAKRMTIQFITDTGPKTTLYGYCYPTNEYSLLRID